MSSTAMDVSSFILSHLAEFGGWAAVLVVMLHFLADISLKRSSQREASNLAERVNELSHELKLRESSFVKHLDLLLDYYATFYRHYRLCQNATNQDGLRLPDGKVINTKEVFFEQLEAYRAESRLQEGKARLVLPAHLLALHGESIAAFNEFKDAMLQTNYDESFHKAKYEAFGRVDTTKQALETGLREFLRTEHLLRARV